MTREQFELHVKARMEIEIEAMMAEIEPAVMKVINAYYEWQLELLYGDL